jgi:hypothetical protein
MMVVLRKGGVPDTTPPGTPIISSR